jgi:hypothetical protein
MTRLALGLAALAAACSVACARAQLIDCEPPERTAFMVFLNEPQYTSAAFASRDKMLAVFDRLQKHLDQREDLEWLLSPDIPVRVARCEKRTPAIDGRDFASPALVESLNNRGVLLEIWGMLDQGPRAQINYLLVPVRNSANNGETDVPSMLRFDYPATGMIAADYVDLLSNADLHAFIAASLGAKAFKQRKLDIAHEYLCKASPRLLQIEQRLATAPATQAQAQSIRRLRGYLLALATRAVKEAPSPVVALQNPANPCAERSP